MVLYGHRARSGLTPLRSFPGGADRHQWESGAGREDPGASPERRRLLDVLGRGRPAVRERWRSARGLPHQPARSASVYTMIYF